MRPPRATTTAWHIWKVSRISSPGRLPRLSKPLGRRFVSARPPGWNIELAVVRRGAEQMEAKALEASSAGKEELRQIYQHHADYYRWRERELLGMSD